MERVGRSKIYYVRKSFMGRRKSGVKVEVGGVTMRYFRFYGYDFHYDYFKERKTRRE